MSIVRSCRKRKSVFFASAKSMSSSPSNAARLWDPAIQSAIFFGRLNQTMLQVEDIRFVAILERFIILQSNAFDM